MTILYLPPFLSVSTIVNWTNFFFPLLEEFELSNDISLFETAEKRSLSELGIGKKSGAKILAIKENEKLFTNPGGNFILQPGQVLIAFGSKEQLNILNGLLGNLVVAVELLK